MTAVVRYRTEQGRAGRSFFRMWKDIRVRMDSEGQNRHGEDRRGRGRI